MSTRKYRMLFSTNRRRKPGPKGPSAELVRAVVEMKQRNPNWGCPRIAQQIALGFNAQIDKDVVRRILAQHYRPGQNSDGPSWLTLLGHMKDSLWSIDLFRCESATLRTHWVLVVMDQYTRRIIGFGVHAGTVDGVALCRRFKRAIRGQYWMPKYLSSDNDPLYRFSQWQANLRILELTQIRSIENKLLDFRTYFNNHRAHTSLKGRTPDTPASRRVANLRFDGSHTVGPYIRHQWLLDSSKIHAGYDIKSPSAEFQGNHLVFLHRSAFRGSDRLAATVSIRQGQAMYGVRRH